MKMSTTDSPRASLAWLGAGLAVFALTALLPQRALAGYFELSAGFSYNNSNFGSANDYEWVKRYSLSLGYHFTEHTEVEVAFQDSTDRTSISGYQDTTFHDQSFTAAWIQSFLGREAVVDPYIRLGLGQLNHTATGTYAILGGASADAEVDSLTEVLGIGVRIGISKRFGVRFEGDTYITNFKISDWQKNDYFMAGLSFYF